MSRGRAPHTHTQNLSFLFFFNSLVFLKKYFEDVDANRQCFVDNCKLVCEIRNIIHCHLLVDLNIMCQATR